MVTLYNTYTRYTCAHYQEFIEVKFLQGLVIIAISQLLDLYAKISPVTVQTNSTCMTERSVVPFDEREVWILKEPDVGIEE